MAVETLALGAASPPDVLLLGELMLNEDVKKCVVEGHVPELPGEHCAEVCAARAHGLGEADHGGALGGHRHVLGGSREPDDVLPVSGEHWLADFNVSNMLSGVKKLMSGATSQADCARFL